jgi:hypothetical protein
MDMVGDYVAHFWRDRVVQHGTLEVLKAGGSEVTVVDPGALEHVVVSFLENLTPGAYWGWVLVKAVEVSERGHPFVEEFHCLDAALSLEMQ